MSKLILFLILLYSILHSVLSNPLFTCSIPFLILHSNDINSRYRQVSQSMGRCIIEKNCYGGLARISHVVKTERNKTTPVLYLIAGNTFTGAGDTKIVADYVNKLAPNATALGENELNKGIEDLYPYIEQLKVPIVCSNMDTSRVPFLKDKIQKSLILEINEVKVGIVGYVNDNARNFNIGNLIFEDEIHALRRETSLLKNNGVKIIIALGHSGFNKDKKIAAEVPLVDIVIGGEATSLLWNGEEPDLEKKTGPYPAVVHQKSGRKVPVVHVFGFTKYLGRILVNFSTAGMLLDYKGNPILLSNKVPQDPEILAMGSVEKPSARNICLFFYLMVLYCTILR